MAKARGKKASRPKARRAKAAPARKRAAKVARAKPAKPKAPRKTLAARKRARKAPPKKVSAAPRRSPAAVVPPDRSPSRGHHDMGGLPAGKVKATEHDYALWEKRVDAMMVLLSDARRRLMNTDMLRRGIESLPADAYERMSYYERWIHSITTMMLERGVVTRAELDARIARLRAAQPK